MQMIELPNPDIQLESLKFSPDGRLLATWDESRVFVIDPATNAVRQLSERTRRGWGFYKRTFHNPGIGFTADGADVVAFHLTYREAFQNTVATIRVYDVVTGSVKRERPYNGSWKLDFGPEARWVYAIPNEVSRGGVIRWNPLSDELPQEFGWSKFHLRQVAVSPDGQCVAGSAGDGVKVWILHGNKVPGRASKKFAKEGAKLWFGHALAVSSAGTFVAASSNRVDVWDVATGNRWTVNEIADNRWSTGRDLVFHPVRPLLALPGDPGEVKFYDVAARSEVKRFAWGVGNVTAIAFSPDGLRCAAAGVGKVVVWDVDV